MPVSYYRRGDTEKNCGRCQTTKPIEEFYPRKGYFSSYCKKCNSISSAEYRGKVIKRRMKERWATVKGFTNE